MKTRLKITLLGLASVLSLTAFAQEGQIRKALGESLLKGQTIDQVSKSEINGLYEVRINGTDIIYTDSAGKYLVEGRLIEATSKRNLTQERVDKLTQIAFKDLPLKDSFTIVRGSGERQLAIFEDPNCGYCKRFERDLQKVENVTIHVFLYPILGKDSHEKSKALWCSADKAKAWQDFMVRDITPPEPKADCDIAALTRNVEIGRKHKVNGTPTLLFVDGRRVPGAIDAVKVEQIFKEMAEKKPS